MSQRTVANIFRKSLFILWIFNHTKQQIFNRIITIRIELSNKQKVKENDINQAQYYKLFDQKKEKRNYHYFSLEDTVNSFIVHIFDFELTILFEKDFIIDIPQLKQYLITIYVNNLEFFNNFYKKYDINDPQTIQLLSSTSDKYYKTLVSIEEDFIQFQEAQRIRKQEIEIFNKFERELNEFEIKRRISLRNLNPYVPYVFIPHIVPYVFQCI